MEEAAIPSLLLIKMCCQSHPMFRWVREQQEKAGVTQNTDCASNRGHRDAARRRCPVKPPKKCFGQATTQNRNSAPTSPTTARNSLPKELRRHVRRGPATVYELREALARMSATTRDRECIEAFLMTLAASVETYATRPRSAYLLGVAADESLCESCRVLRVDDRSSVSPAISWRDVAKELSARQEHATVNDLLEALARILPMSDTLRDQVESLLILTAAGVELRATRPGIAHILDQAAESALADIFDELDSNDGES